MLESEILKTNIRCNVTFSNMMEISIEEREKISRLPIDLNNNLYKLLNDGQQLAGTYVHWYYHVIRPTKLWGFSRFGESTNRVLPFFGINFRIDEKLNEC